MDTLRGDLLDPDCPTRAVMDAIGDKWGSVILVLLERGGSIRFNELARLAEGISFKMLAQTLRRLERDGFVSRTVAATSPPAVSYALTPLAATLMPALATLRDWAESHIGAVLSARTTYDRREAS